MLKVLRDNFGGERIPTAAQRCNALSTWLQYCSGTVTENTADTILLQRFRGMRDAVRNILKANKRGLYSAFCLVTILFNTSCVFAELLYRHISAFIYLSLYIPFKVIRYLHFLTSRREKPKASLWFRQSVIWFLLFPYFKLYCQKLLLWIWIFSQ